MSHTPHALIEELPEFAEAIVARKQADPHFARLVDAYHDINEAVVRGETNLAPTDDFHLEEMKKARLAQLDELKRLLTAEAA